MNKALKNFGMYIGFPVLSLIAVENIFGTAFNVYETERLKHKSRQEAYEYCLKVERSLILNDESLAYKVMDFGVKVTNDAYLRNLEKQIEK